jgi:hypothetical protein
MLTCSVVQNSKMNKMNRLDGLNEKDLFVYAGVNLLSLP